MATLETYYFELNFSSSGIHLWTNHYNLGKELIDYVLTCITWEPGIYFRADNRVFINELGGHDIDIGNNIVRKVRLAGWRLENSNDVYSYRFTLTELTRNVVDELKDLEAMWRDETISAQQYTACKVKLTGTY